MNPGMFKQYLLKRRYLKVILKISTISVCVPVIVIKLERVITPSFQFYISYLSGLAARWQQPNVNENNHLSWAVTMFVVTSISTYLHSNK